MDQTVINSKIYEDGNEYLGIADVTLPDIGYLTQTISGAGIAGNIDTAVIGHIEAMKMSMSFRTTTRECIRLTEPRMHTIDIRVAQQEEDTVTRQIKVTSVKHVMVIMPTGYKSGKLSPASPSNGSGDYSVRVWKTYIDGKPVLEVDPANYKFVVNGIDYLAEVRAALGM